MFSNIPSLPLLPEVGHQDISFIHKTTSAPHPAPLFSPVRSTTAPLRAQCAGLRSWGQNRDKSCWCRGTVFLRQWRRCITFYRQGCGPKSCALFLIQGVMLTVPCVTQWDIDVREELSAEPHTEQPMYISTESSFLNQDDNFCDDRISNCAQRIRGSGCWRICVSPRPRSSLGFVGWIQLDTAVMVTVCGIFLILPQRRYTVSSGANAWAKALFGHLPPLAQQTHGRF